MTVRGSRRSWRRLVTAVFLITSLTTQLTAQEIETAEKPDLWEPVVTQLDALGQAILRWPEPTEERESWVFGSIALYTRRGGATGRGDPLPNFQRIIPEMLWPDFKHMTFEGLNELGDGLLYHSGDMLAWRPTQSFRSLDNEQQILAYLTGMRHLRMLEATIGDTLFWQVMRESVSRTDYAYNLCDTLGVVLAEHSTEVLAGKFLKALASPDRSDLELRSVKRTNGSYTLDIRQNGAWSFPFDILAISTEGDSILFQNIDLLGPDFRFVSMQRIKRIILDPEHKIVEVYRFNNHWPRIRGNWRIQPLWALPDWEALRVVVSPVVWQDWDSEQRYGLKIGGGFGVDLMPAYPADFRHRYTLEANSFGPVDQMESWGVRASYHHPISWTYRLFMNGRAHSFQDWQGYKIGLTNYPGSQRYLIQGPDIRFRRINLSAGYDAYQDRSTWGDPQRLRYLQLDYVTFSLTESGNRMNVKLNGAWGRSSETHIDNYYVFKSKVDLSGVFASWLSGDFRLVTGVQSEQMPEPYQFTNQYAWNNSLSWLPRFRGQPRYEDPVSKYLGVSFATGYWLNWIQFKIFTSALLYSDDMDPVFETQPRYAAGVGLEHRAFFTIGFYIPFWQSHPLPGEDPWAWRYEWKFEWNL